MFHYLLLVYVYINSVITCIIQYCSLLASICISVLEFVFLGKVTTYKVQINIFSSLNFVKKSKFEKVSTFCLEHFVVNICPFTFCLETDAKVRGLARS